MAGTEFTIKVENLDKLKTAFSRYPQISEPVLQKGLFGAAALLAKYTRRDPVPFRTGNLLQSFRQDSGRLYVRWYPTANYALFVHEGTRPHVITSQKLLVSREGTVFGRRVNHPGTKPNPFMPKILSAAQPEIDQLFEGVLDQITSDLAR